MGHSIVYCDKCGQLLKEEDFRLGKASTADNRSYCAACRPVGTSTSLPKQIKVSTARIPSSRPSACRPYRRPEGPPRPSRRSPRPARTRSC
jgi:hypothetical protein